MAVTLTKLADGKSVVSDTLPNDQPVKCPLCDQLFRLGYSDSEWNRVKDWLGLAERAIRDDHNKRRHEVLSLTWNDGETSRKR
jgi:hypothetical protein